MLFRIQVVIALGATFLAPLRGQIEEYQVKAFFLYNFARYVEWPSERFSARKDPIVICILGPNPFGGALLQAIAGKVVGDHPLVVHQISSIETNCDCHILFVNSSAQKQFRSQSGRLSGSSVLSVGENPEFIANGGVLNLKLDGDKVRFEVSLDAAARDHLRMSSKLLSLAEIVK